MSTFEAWDELTLAEINTSGALAQVKNVRDGGYFKLGERDGRILSMAYTDLDNALTRLRLVTKLLSRELENSNAEATA